MITYDQCSVCKRLIPGYHPEAQASVCPPLYTYVNGAKVCWECLENEKKRLGVVPYRDVAPSTPAKEAGE